MSTDTTHEYTQEEEREAERLAIASGFGVSEWESFLPMAKTNLASVSTPAEPQHVLITPATCDCNKLSDDPCPVCDGGLAMCSVCHKAEAELDEPCAPPAEATPAEPHDHEIECFTVGGVLDCEVDNPPTPPATEAAGLPMPTNVESVAWAEEADRLANALWDLLHVIEADDLIPESVSYMRQARKVLRHWPTRQETEEAKERIWNRIQSQLK